MLVVRSASSNKAFESCLKLLSPRIVDSTVGTATQTTWTRLKFYHSTSCLSNLGPESVLSLPSQGHKALTSIASLGLFKIFTLLFEKPQLSKLFHLSSRVLKSFLLSFMHTIDLGLPLFDLVFLSLKAFLLLLHDLLDLAVALKGSFHCSVGSLTARLAYDYIFLTRLLLHRCRVVV